MEIDKAAHRLNHLRKKCAFCEVENSPMWRKGWYDDELDKDMSLCNAHGLRYNKNQYCSVCRWIYLAKEVNPAEWLYCRLCKTWTHRQCDQNNQLDPYVCIDCRNEKSWP